MSTISDLPSAFRCVMYDRHAAEDALLLWQWIEARHTKLKIKFSKPDADKDTIDKHMVSLIKEYRNQKGKFAARATDDDGWQKVKGSKKGKNNKGKGKSKGKGMGSSSNAGAQER